MAHGDVLPPLSEAALTLVLGSKYAHYKSGEYEVVAVGRMEVEPNEEVVVYRSVSEGHVWVRPVESFLESVATSDYSGPRFIPM